MVRGIGVIYLIAIISWWSQITLLVGESGLIPAGNLLEWVGERSTENGTTGFALLPGIFWLTGASDFALQFACWVGVMLALLVIFGRATGPALIGLWFLYLSLLNTGGVFMSFQWDILLLEAGFLAIFLCDWHLKSPWRDPPALSLVNRVALVWAWLLIAKLMFFSGWVKLAWAGEAYPEWWPTRDALSYHYMTQPIPTWTAWYAHHLPEWIHAISIWMMYLIELVLPFAIFFGRFGRLTAAIGFTLLMVLISLTGNYTYFNWLTIVLCLPLVHDRLWPRFLREWLNFVPPGPVPPPDWKRRAAKFVVAGPVFVAIFLLNAHVVFSDLHTAPNPVFPKKLTPQWLDNFRRTTDSYRLVSGYGLFRTMTTKRPEIILEGSRDGTSWFAYDFAWKVDDITDRPKFVAPHQPRVAWQFWFAALEQRFNPRSRNAAWIESLVLKLLAGDREVEALLKSNPFPETPPEYIRARLYNYEFTTPEERKRTGDWWKRVAAGDFLPTISASVLD